MKFKFPSYRFKLNIIMLASLAMILFLYSSLILKFQEEALMQRMSQVCFILMKTLSKSAKDGLLLRRHDLVEEAVHLLNQYTIEGLNTMAIIDQKGNLVIAVDSYGYQANLDPQKLQNALKYDEITVIETPKEFEFYSPISSQLRENGRTKEFILGVAYMSFAKNVLMASNTKARKVAIILAILVVIISSFFINYIAKRLVKPIEQISEGVKKITNGDLDFEIKIGSKDELGFLANYINNLTQQLKHSIKVKTDKTKIDTKTKKEFDVFICYASEDRESPVRPLALELKQLGVNVWYDEFQVKVGDSIRRKVDQGLKNSKYGVVIISDAFFDKKWTQYELNGLFAKETESSKVILPIWHKISRDEVLWNSPILADKLALNTSLLSIKDIAKQLYNVLEN